MTFLDLCQLLVRETGLAGNGPTSVSTQVGILKKVVDWVSRAYEDVQNEEENWRWLWRKTTLVTEVGKREYTPAELGLTDFNQWIEQSFFARRPVETQRFPLEYMDYEQFNNMFLVNQDSQPLIYTFLPNKNLMIDVAPRAAETWEFEYWRVPFEFVNNGDTPAFPSHHHKIILYRAMMLYAADEEAPNIYADAQTQYDKRLSKLRDAELVEPHFHGVPLA